MEAGKHDFKGCCAPGEVATIPNQKMFSLGIFQWVPKHNGKGCKRGAVKVRVKGPFNTPSAVYEKAEKIVAELDAGAYIGPKNVTV